jgi:hypothetical protein
VPMHGPQVDMQLGWLWCRIAGTADQSTAGSLALLKCCLVVQCSSYAVACTSLQLTASRYRVCVVSGAWTGELHFYRCLAAD